MLESENNVLDVEAVRERISSIKAETSSIVEQIKQAIEREKELQAEFDRQKIVLAEEQKKASERDELQKEIQLMKSAIAENTKSDQDIIARFQSHLEVLKQEVKVADDDLARIIHENSEIEGAITKLNDERKQLRQALSDLQEDHIAAENASPITQENNGLICGQAATGFLF